MEPPSTVYSIVSTGWLIPLGPIDGLPAVFGDRILGNPLWKVLLSIAAAMLVSLLVAALASGQRCRVHFTRNAVDLVPRSARGLVATVIRTIFEQPDEAAAREQRVAIIDGAGRLVSASSAHRPALVDIPYPRHRQREAPGATSVPRDRPIATEPAQADEPREESGEYLTMSDLARTAGADEAFVARLVDLGLLMPDGQGHLPGDIYRLRFAALAEASGISLDDLAASLAAGVVRMGDVDLLFPEPVETSRTTHAGLASELDVEADLLRRIRLAAGLTARGPEEPVQRDEERILRLIVQLSHGFGDVETSIRIARNYGERIQRIVVSAVGAYEEFVYGPLIDSMPTIDADTRRRTSQEGRSLIDKAEELLTATHRRHMEAALLAMWVRTTEAQMVRHGVVETPPERPPAIAFVDLSDFTRLTEEEGDEAGVWLASQLVATTEVTAAAHGSHIVKLLGDGVMLHCADPGRLIDTAVELVEALPRAGLPPAHVGIHAGPLIERDGDYFGRTVNVAARIAIQARHGEVLVSDAAAARASADLRLTELPAVSLRGVSEPLVLFRVDRS